MIDWFKKRKAQKELEKYARKVVERDEYLSRLKRSADHFSGCRHSTGGETLSIREIHNLIIKEYESELRKLGINQ